MVVALVALTVALSGTGYAAVQLTKNSVGATQIRTGAVRSAEVKDRSLRARDFARGTLRRGATGPRGATGAAGPAGPPGPATAATPANGSVGPDQLATVIAARVEAPDPLGPDAQVLVASAYVPLVVTDETYDTAALHSGSTATFTAPRTGVYHVEGWVEFPSAGNAFRRMRIRSGSTTLAEDGRPPVSGARTQSHISTDARLTQGQQVEVQVSSDATVSLQDGAASISYVGPIG